MVYLCLRLHLSFPYSLRSHARACVCACACVFVCIPSVCFSSSLNIFILVIHSISRMVHHKCILSLSLLVHTNSNSDPKFILCTLQPRDALSEPLLLHTHKHAHCTHTKREIEGVHTMNPSVLRLNSIVMREKQMILRDAFLYPVLSLFFFFFFFYLCQHWHVNI